MSKKDEFEYAIKYFSLTGAATSHTQYTSLIADFYLYAYNDDVYEINTVRFFTVFIPETSYNEEYDIESAHCYWCFN